MQTGIRLLLSLFLYTVLCIALASFLFVCLRIFAASIVTETFYFGMLSYVIIIVWSIKLSCLYDNNDNNMVDQTKLRVWKAIPLYEFKFVSVRMFEVF